MKKKKRSAAQQYKDNGKERGNDECINLKTHTQGPSSSEKQFNRAGRKVKKKLKEKERLANRKIKLLCAKP